MKNKQKTISRNSIIGFILLIVGFGVLSLAYVITRYDQRSRAASWENSYTLPIPWKGTALGESKATFSFKNKIFTIQGVLIRDKNNQKDDNFAFLYRDFSGSSELVAHIQRTNGKQGSVGVMIRSSLMSLAPGVALSVEPVSPDNNVNETEDMLEYVNMYVKNREGDSYSSIGSVKLNIGIQSIWLKLRKTGNNVEGSYSYDGNIWIALNKTAQFSYGTYNAGAYVSYGGMQNPRKASLDTLQVHPLTQ